MDGTHNRGEKGRHLLRDLYEPSHVGVWPGAFGDQVEVVGHEHVRNDCEPRGRGSSQNLIAANDNDLHSVESRPPIVRANGDEIVSNADV